MLRVYTVHIYSTRNVTVICIFVLNCKTSFILGQMLRMQFSCYETCCSISSTNEKENGAQKSSLCVEVSLYLHYVGVTLRIWDTKEIP